MTDRSALPQVRSFQILTGADSLLADHTAMPFDDMGASLTDSRLDPFPDEVAETSASPEGAQLATGADHELAETLLATVNYEAINARQDAAALGEANGAPIANDVIHTFDAPTVDTPILGLGDVAAPAAVPQAAAILSLPHDLVSGDLEGRTFLQEIGSGVPSAPGGHDLSGIFQATAADLAYESLNAQQDATAIAHGNAGPLLNDVVGTFDTPTSFSPIVALFEAASAGSADGLVAAPSSLLASDRGLSDIFQVAASDLAYEAVNAHQDVAALAHADTGPLLNDVVGTFDTPTPSSPIVALLDAATPSVVTQVVAADLAYEALNAHQDVAALAHADTGPLLNDVVGTFDTPTPSSPIVALLDAATPSVVTQVVAADLAYEALNAHQDVAALAHADTGPLLNDVVGTFDAPTPSSPIVALLDAATPSVVTQVVAADLAYEALNAHQDVAALAHADTGPLLNDVVGTFDTPTPSSPIVALIDAATESALAAPIDSIVAAPSALLGGDRGPSAVTQVVAADLAYEALNAHQDVAALAHADTGPLLNDVVGTLDTPTPSSPIVALIDAATPSAIVAAPSALPSGDHGASAIIQVAAADLAYEALNAHQDVAALAHADTGPLLNDAVGTLDTPTPSSPIVALLDAATPSVVTQVVASELAYEALNAHQDVAALAHADTGPLLNDVIGTLDMPTPSSPIVALIDAATPSAIAAPIDSIVAAPSALLGGDAVALGNPPADAAPVVALVDAASPGTLVSGAAGNAGALGGGAATSVETLAGSVSGAADALTPVVHDAAGAVVADIASSASALGGSVGGATGALASSAQSDLGTGVSQVTGSVGALGGAVVGAATDVVSTVHADLGGAAADITGAATTLAGSTTGALNETVSAVHSDLSGVASSATDAVDSLGGSASGVLTSAASGVQGDIGAVAASAATAGGSISGAVTGAVGDTVATVHADLVPVVADATSAAGSVAASATGAIGDTTSAVHGDLSTAATDVVTAGSSVAGSVTTVAAAAQADVAHVIIDASATATAAAATVSVDTSATLTAATHVLGTTLTDAASTVHADVGTVSADTGIAAATAVGTVGTGIETATSAIHAGLDTVTTDAGTGLATATTAIGTGLADVTSTAHADIGSVSATTGAASTSATGTLGTDVGDVASTAHADLGTVSADVGSATGTAASAVGTGLADATSTVHADLGSVSADTAGAVSNATTAVETGLSTGPALATAAIGSATTDVASASSTLAHAVGAGLDDATSAVSTGLGAAASGGGALTTATSAVGTGLGDASITVHDASLTTTTALAAATGAVPSTSSLFTIASNDGAIHFPTTSGAGADALTGIVASPAAPVTSAADSVSHAVVATAVDHVDVPHADPLAALAHAAHHA